MLTIDFLKAEYRNSKELWRMLEALDIISLNHSIRVCEICRYIEEDLNFPNRNFSEAGLFHDIGKYFVSVNLLNKRGKLSSTEKTLIDLHCYLSFKVLKFNKKNDEICEMALFHHGFKPVMIDDKGVCYDETTKKLSLMLKTVDIYEALTTDRPYHRGVSNEEAVKTILNNDSYDKETLNIINECHTKFE